MLNNNDNVNKESIIQQKSLELPLSGKERFLDETLGNRRLHSATYFHILRYQARVLIIDYTS